MHALLSDALAASALLLNNMGIDSPRLSAEVLWASALGIERNELLKRLILTPGYTLDKESLSQGWQRIGRRLEGEPVAYILGEKEFYGHLFKVTPHTLIPRPETELLVDTALALSQGVSPLLPSGSSALEYGFFADLGAGSGCVGISLALQLPAWQGFALEKSTEALQVVTENIRHLNVKNLCCLNADFTNLPFKPDSLHLIVSNPPYISGAEYNTLNKEIQNFEPKNALVPSIPASQIHTAASGLEHASAIINQAYAALYPGGWLLMEIGCSQAPPLLTQCSTICWSQAKILPDLAGLNRVLAAQKRA